MAKILAICTSPEKGTEKRSVGRATLVANWGIDGDAHAGSWHRQISLLSAARIAEFNERGAAVQFGAFGENIVADIDFRSMPVGTLLAAGGALLEITQIGKQCHHGCAIFARMGDCIMPREGVFARVLRGGEIAEGEELAIVPREGARPYQAAVITLSDKGARGEREDKSGPAIAARLLSVGYEIAEALLLPDGMEPLCAELKRLCDQRQLDLILTTGGTGLTARDVTPEATRAVGEREVPGISEAIRAYSLRITPRAMFTRGACVTRGKTLILNLPVIPKAVE